MYGSQTDNRPAQHPLGHGYGIFSTDLYLTGHIPRLQARAELRRKRKKLEEEERVPERPAARRPILPDPVEEEEEENLIYDGELVAVIMAAILASTGGAVSADKLVVRSIRRVKSKNRR